jgi:hypothetical protein
MNTSGDDVFEAQLVAFRKGVPFAIVVGVEDMPWRRPEVEKGFVIERVRCHNEFVVLVASKLMARAASR